METPVPESIRVLDAFLNEKIQRSTGRLQDDLISLEDRLQTFAFAPAQGRD